MMMEKDELITAGTKIIGDSVTNLSNEQIRYWLTIGMYMADLCLAELESRNAVEFDERGVATVPYDCDYMVETSLTREGLSSANAD